MGKITDLQKQALVEYLKQNPNLLSGKFSNEFSQKVAAQKWEEITDILNSMNGANKDWRSWRKVCYNDLSSFT